MDKLIQQYQDHAKNGFYSHHLSEISEKGNQAYTTSDIRNDDGVLLARKGMAIDLSVRKRLAQHKLLYPLDTHVGLEHQKDTKSLIQEFKKILDKFPDLNVVNEALRFGPEFERLLKLERLHPIITQKLTVLEAQIPSEFEKSVFSAWLAALIAHEMCLDTYEVRDTMVAALIHDIGLLHLDPEIVCSNKVLTADEWKTVRAHVVVGKIIADAVPGLSPEVARAVVEHHEDCFGSGYPFSLNEEQLGIPGRIINMTDSIHSIRSKSFRDSQRTLGDIKPYLQLNPTTNGYDVYRATMSIIKKSGLQPARVIPDGCPIEYAKNLGNQIDILREAKEALDDIHENLFELSNRIDRNDIKQLSVMAATTRRIRATINESGLLSSEIAEWLQKERDLSDIDDGVMEELNEIELLIKELTWQIRNTVRMFHSYDDAETTDDAMLLEHIGASIESIQEIFDRLSEIKL
jgi:HD-GYP domain-containing protein (c-di-GMP phosphodiesterase class II)